MKIINERPAKMSFETYKEEQNNSRNRVKRYLKGTMFHHSASLIPKLNNVTGEVIQPIQYIGKTKGKTFVGKCDKEKVAKIIARNKKKDESASALKSVA